MSFMVNYKKFRFCGYFTTFSVHLPTNEKNVPYRAKKKKIGTWEKNSITHVPQKE